MLKTKLFYLPLGILTIVTATCGAVLTSMGVSAQTATVDCAVISGTTSYKCTSTVNATVKVGATCSVAASSTTNHSLTLTPGTTTVEGTNAPTTTVTTKCNDGSGFDVYAIGNNGSANSTNLSNGTTNIATGLATSGNSSSWAFKLAKVSGTYTPTTITSGYTAWHVIPSSQTKIVSRSSGTDQSTGSSFKATYQIYLASGQAAGTYTGGVKYTLVHPAGTTAPAN